MVRRRGGGLFHSMLGRSRKCSVHSKLGELNGLMQKIEGGRTMMPQLLNSRKNPPRTCSHAHRPPLGILPASRTLCLLLTLSSPSPSGVRSSSAMWSSCVTCAFSCTSSTGASRIAKLAFDFWLLKGDVCVESWVIFSSWVAWTALSGPASAVAVAAAPL